MRIRRLSAAAAVLIPFALAGPVTGARADAAPTAAAPAPASPAITFIPPRVGPLSVILGATYIGGQMISPGVSVATPGTSLPPITWTPPL